jgi:hypothetical protein
MLRELKENILERAIRMPGTCAKLSECSDGDDSAATQQDHAITDAPGIVELVDGEEQRAPGRGMRPQHGGYIASLAQIQSFKGFVEKQDWSRSHETECDQCALALSARE